MKRYGLIILMMFLALVVLTGGVGAATTIQGTKHDLSAPALGGFGPGPIRSSATGTGQICVFCHTPHSAAAITNAPLWNKNFDPASDPGYTVYSSDVLTAYGITADKPLTSIKAVHLKTRLCLSCHDGTIALGQLANLPAGFSGSQITMVGTGADNKMPQSAAGWIGLELQDDHPVAIPHADSVDLELRTPPFTDNKVKVFADGGTNYVECTSCHDPHSNAFGNFLVESNAGSTICTRCHNKTGFGGSIHDTSAQPYQPTDGAGGNLGVTVGGVKCMDCHFPHKAGVEDSAKMNPVPTQGKYLLSYKEEQSCFINNPNLDRWNTAGSATSCHGSLGAKNIYTEVNKGSAHKVGAYSGLHEATEAQQFVAGGWSTGKWHVECQDCHNPHTANNINHIPNRGAPNGNSVLNTSPLYGTGGVSVTSWPAFPPPSTGLYSPIQPTGVTDTNLPPATGVTYEYEICFKCHTDFAWGIMPPNSPLLGQPMTNQAMEFNTNNVSYHPVVQTTNAGVNHQPVPPQGTLTAVWNVNKGNQTMYCSDCHTKEGDALPTGPHGSNNAGILSKPFDDQSGLPQPPALPAQSSGDICFDCHDPAVYLTPSLGGTPGTTGFSSPLYPNLHVRHAYREILGNTVTVSNPINYKCTNCHVRIPHGWIRQSMIILQGEGATYGTAYEATYGAKIQPPFTPNTGNYGLGGCITVAGCHHWP